MATDRALVELKFVNYPELKGRYMLRWVPRPEGSLSAVVEFDARVLFEMPPLARGFNAEDIKALACAIQARLETHVRDTMGAIKTGQATEGTPKSL